MVEYRLSDAVDEPNDLYSVNFNHEEVKNTDVEYLTPPDKDEGGVINVITTLGLFIS